MSSLFSPQGRRFPAWSPVLMGVIFMFLLAGCQADQPAEQQPQTVRIGVIYPLSGADGATGQDLVSGINLALQIINEDKDINIPLGSGEGLTAHGNIKVEVLFRDHQGSSEKAVQLVDELVQQEHVAALVGCYQSSITEAASERAEMLEIPFINFSSTAPLLTQRDLKWFFRVTPDDAMFAENFFTFLSQMESQGKPVPHQLCLVYENTLWGTGVSQAEIRLASEQGYSIVADVPYDSKSQDYTSEIEQIGSVMPAIIMQASYEKDAIAYVHGYKGKGINPVAVLAMDSGFLSTGYLQQVGGEGDYIFSRETWAPDLTEKLPVAKAVNDMYRTTYGRDMNGSSARTFTGMMVLGLALDQAEDFSPDAVRKALLAVDLPADQLIMPWKGVKFDARTGQNVLGQGIIVQLQEKKYRIVWPRELAGAEPVWPMPQWEDRSP